MFDRARPDGDVEAALALHPGQGPDGQPPPFGVVGGPGASAAMSSPLRESWGGDVERREDPSDAGVVHATAAQHPASDEMFGFSVGPKQP